MAEQIISPGVFTRENDLSFLPQGVGAIGAAIVGPTHKGPAFVPTVVRSFSEYEQRFGPLSSETYVPQTVREYLKNAGSVTVCRVLAGGGFTFSNGAVEPVALIAGSGSAVAGVAATGSLVFTATFFTDEGDELQITNPAGTEFRIIASGGPADDQPADDTSAGIFFAPTGSDAQTSIDSIVAKIGTANALGIGLKAVDGTTTLQLTASNAGVAGNGFTFETGSGGTIGTDSGLATAGGKNAVANKGVLVGLIYPAKSTNANPSLGDSSISPTTTGIINNSFAITLNGSNVGQSSGGFSASLNPGNSDYLFTQIGNNPNGSKSSLTQYAGMPGYTHLNFKTLQNSILATDNLTTYSGLSSGSSVVLATAGTTDCVLVLVKQKDMDMLLHHLFNLNYLMEQEKTYLNSIQ